MAVEYGLPLPFLIIVATLVKTVPLVQIGMYSSVLVSGNSIDCDVRINLQYEMLIGSVCTVTRFVTFAV